MPLRIVSRLEGSYYRVLDVDGEPRYGLEGGQIILPADPLAHLLQVAEHIEAPGHPPPPPALVQLGLRSYIGVPIPLSDGQRAGCLSAADTGEQYFSPPTRESLALLARMLGHEIERAERERELRILTEISHAFVRQTDIHGTFQEVVEQAVSLFDADYCLLHRIDLAAALLTLVAAKGVPLPIGIP